jgi:DUF1680 family protein
VRTGYPWDGEIRIAVDRAPADKQALVLRIPGWAEEAAVFVNDAPADEVAEGGWLTVSRVFAPGDEIRLVLRMPARAHGSHPYLDATRGAVAVARGPLVYCVEQQDVPAAVDDLLLAPSAVAGARAVTRTVADGDAVVLEVATAVAPPPAENLYPVLRDDPAAGRPSPEVTATFVPYFLWGNREARAMRVWLRQT